MGTVFNALEKSNQIDKNSQNINQISETQEDEELNKEPNQLKLSFIEKLHLFSHIFDPFESPMDRQKFPEEYQKKI